MASPSRSSWISAYVLAYLYWLASTVFAAYLAFELRGVLLAFVLAVAAGGKRATPAQAFYLNLQMRAADSWATILMGIVLVLAVVALESLFRNRALTHDSKELFLRLSSWACTGAAVCELVYLMIVFLVNGFKWVELNNPILTVLLAVFIAWQRANYRPSPPQ